MRFAPLLVLLFAAPSFAQRDPKLEDYQSEAGRFKVKLPGRPKTESKDLATGRGKQVITVTTEKVDTLNGAVFAVTYADYPDSYKDAPAKTILEGVRDGLKGTDGKVIKDEETSVQLNEAKIPGRDLRIEAGKSVIRARIFIHGQRLYQVLVTGTKDTVNTKDADAFLKSFELAK